MEQDIAANLLKKGWSKTDARRTADIIAHAQADKSTTMLFVEQMAFWIALLTAVLGNFILSVVMVPFLILLSGIGLYITVFLIGITFGMIFNVLVHYIEEIDAGEHVIAGAFIPALALINMYIITHFSNKIEVLLQLETPSHSPLLVSATYVIAFVIPYLLKHLQHIRKKEW